MSDLAADVGDAMADYLEAKRVRDEARASCDYDWGYFGTRFEEELEKRASDLDRALNAFTNRKEKS